MTDPGTLIIDPANRERRNELHLHIRGVYGNCGEDESVLSIIALMNAGPNYPSSGLIVIGSPVTSPLLEGHLPNTGIFSCGIEGAERLITALQRAVAAVREAP